MKTLRIPLLGNLEDRDLDTSIELEGNSFRVDNVNWPEKYPYSPFCAGRIARTEDSIVVDFRVSGLDLRAVNMEDCGRIWEDSCCEFFVQAPDGSEYFNFEVNPAGFLVASHGPAREGREPLPAEDFARIVRITSVSGLSSIDSPVEFEGGLWNWRVMLIIPFDIIGVDADNLPAKLRGNFYKCGDRTAHPHFASWAPISTPTPDFHRPEFFGELTF